MLELKELLSRESDCRIWMSSLELGFFDHLCLVPQLCWLPVPILSLPVGVPTSGLLPGLNGGCGRQTQGGQGTGTELALAHCGKPFRIFFPPKWPRIEAFTHLGGKEGTEQPSPLLQRAACIWGQGGEGRALTVPRWSLRRLAPGPHSNATEGKMSALK